ncbi:2-oxoglutarate dehydrogenase, E2 subunit, dihydrolipoamide succinyltransferase [Pseudopedobacter saltans DSM 12145]|uniref:Dihydrolipoyllysine-residue succinyltransferase component of 2-oxoglutarate dehydrogenase complex n=1 Tax=Pseudopedobacter saltans (strain ATCC 51119 / DSM 12145 / JCM 21818 / CCUG 39354 / LMG 10337 / NBRC 100064 / NCIMB 13643) TaxID=762903 RepID=F0SE01_PSESL|nr:2-oxoglutarate dehydrogenase complex dihydrolipoyllysine-residue succinyltransferase [Pseudopedobacter saltans]ADY52927.1 2-oxoglutarate dehydrogenase, E2 subunit, dihydrolipoamide succinyltransferase [Pseudopedobacter saltans DSM 12145]
MSLEIKVPAVGESITEVILSKWIKNDGDHVEMDEVIAELESDKATFELTAESEGTLTTVAKEGDTLEIGAVVAKIDSSGEAKASAETPKAAESEEPTTNEPVGEAKTVDIKVPAVGESITEVTLTKWLKADGEAVEMDEVIAELESDKATFELPAEAAGILSTVAKEGDTLEIGAIVATISSSGAAAPKATPPAQEVPKAAESSSKSNYADKTPSPAAAKILAEKGINPQAVSGTGVGGRITKDDANKATAPAAAPQKSAPAASPVSVSATGDRSERREKMTSLRKTIAKRLVSVKNETAMLTTFNEVNMAPVMELRKKYKDQFKEKHGVGLGFMSFFTKAVTEALKDFPAVGARIDGDEIVYSNFADISIAVSAPKGLVVPIIRNADKLSLAGIEKEVINLAVKARENKLSIEEMTGGNFTITNGGVFGSMMSTPIINAPQSAILGMHNIVERPVAENGQVVIRPMMYIALSYDHRIIDGRESVGFLVRVKQLLEDPARLLLGV